MRKFLTFFLTALLAFGVGWASNTYVKVTDASQIVPGKKCIFVSETASLAMGTTWSSSKYQGTAITINDGAVTATENVLELTLGQGQEASGIKQFYLILPDNQYLNYSGDGTSFKRTTNDPGYWRIYEYSGAGFTLQAANNSRYIRKHATSNAFGCYANNSDSQPVYLYIESDGGNTQSVAAPTFSYNNTSATGSIQVNSGDVINIASAEGTVISYTTDGTDPAESNSAVMTEDNSATVSITQGCTIRAIALDDELNESSEATLNVTVYIPPTPSGIIYKKVTGNTLAENGKYILVHEGNPAAAMGQIEKISGSGTKGIAVTDILFDNTVTPYQVDLAGKVALLLTAHATGTEGRYAFEVDETTYLIWDGSANFGTTTSYSETSTNAQWNIAEDGQITNANDATRVIAYRTNNTFGPFSKSNINNTEYFNAYLYKLVEPEPEVPLTVTLTPAPEQPYTVGDNVTVYATVENGNDDTMVTYKVNGGNEQDYSEAGIKLPNTTAGDVVVTVYATDGEREATVTVTYHFNAAPAIEIALDPAEKTYKVGDEAKVKVTITNTIGEYLAEYLLDEEEVTPENGYITLNSDKAGTHTLTVTVSDGYHVDAATATGTYTIDKKDLEASLEGDTELVFTLGDEFTVPTLKGVPEDLNVTYESNDTTVAKVDAEGNVTIVGPGEATITITVEGNDMYNGTTLTYTIKVNDVVENIQTLTFYPASGTYTEAKNVAIACATPGVNIEYKIGDGEWQTYNAPFTVAQSCTVTAKATKGTRTVWVDSEATATYTINAKAPVQIANGYYNLKSNGINQYANIQGRRTLTFTNDIDKQAGTVLQVETDANGQVKTLRSQGVDIQGYAKRAMAYVPTIVQKVVDKLNAEGEGNLLGENGLDAIKAKFDECFDYHLYVEGSEGAYRIYGRTPSMQPVVDFYAENKDKVDAKLPQLEEFIQSAIVKLRNKANGAGYDGTTVFEDFTLHKIWKRMGSNLIEPVDDASKMAFYQQVLTNKQYVWDFAYQTAMLYINNVTESETYKNLAAENEDLDLLVNKMTSIRPETKYFIIENGNELDYVSENHTYIINDNAQTYWSLSPREDFTVTFPEENKVNDSYYTTLYTDFAYNVPEDVTAYAVTGIDGNNLADLTAFTGTIPAQTPVLLMTKDNGAKAVTKALELTTETGTVPEGNLLVGPDYLINEYKLTSPTVEGLFNMAQAILKQDLYNEYVKPYEYLMLKTAGTVNNKYFWGLTQADVEKCVAGEDNDCVIRNLVGDEFVNNWTAPKNNEAFLVSADKDVIYLSLEPAEAPTFSPVPGSYTSNDPIDVTITGPAGATIEYSTDGGNTWDTYNDTPISVNGEVTILARTKATQSGTSESETVKGYYIIDKPDELPTMDPFDGYYSVKNNGNEKYVNVAGRKTITFAREADIDKMAGTVIYLKTDEHGQVQSLRSQAADLQGYADKAMRYVPEIVQMAVDKLHAEGEGNLLGETGLDSIMAKFNKCFDHHLYVEPADGGYRLYGKTPNMQHVVDFYRDHKDKVEAKLPQLETFINSAITKVLEKTGGRGASILKPFSLLQTWQRMDSALVDADLIKPVDEATTMDFYRQVLNNKKYVWAFAYETAMTYWERLKANQTFQNNIDKLGEFAQYIDKIEQIRPDFKYYIVQDNNQIDYISEGNVDINNNQPRTVWTLTPRDKFTVNFDSNMTMDDRLYYTTLYTDFAYSLPEGVKAYKVTEVNENGVGAIEALEGTIPAQTPVLLKANAAGDVELTIAAAGDADVTGNLLVGADYFINEYQINTPQVEGLFEMVASIFGENSTFYQELLTKYGHLMLKTSGTVNNKYFWALTNDDLNQCVAGEDNDCVVRKLNNGEDGLGFYENWEAPANQAFLASSEFNPVKLLLGKDVTRDGLWNVVDVTATISIILETAPVDNNYDYDAADFNNDGTINVVDVTAMIAYILGI